MPMVLKAGEIERNAKKREDVKALNIDADDIDLPLDGHHLLREESRDLLEIIKRTDKRLEIMNSRKL